MYIHAISYANYGLYDGIDLWQRELRFLDDLFLPD